MDKRLTDLFVTTQEFATNVMDLNAKYLTSSIETAGKMTTIALGVNFMADTYLRSIVNGIETVNDYAKRSVKYQFPYFAGN